LVTPSSVLRLVVPTTTSWSGAETAVRPSAHLPKVPVVEVIEPTRTLTDCAASAVTASPETIANTTDDSRGRNHSAAVARPRPTQIAA
jgi:hypothetical protein